MERRFVRSYRVLRSVNHDVHSGKSSFGTCLNKESRAISERCVHDKLSFFVCGGSGDDVLFGSQNTNRSFLNVTSKETFDTSADSLPLFHIVGEVH